MTDQEVNDDPNQGVQQNAEKDPKDWATGDEPITGAQRSYLETLAQEAKEDLDLDNMTKAQASIEIDRLQGETGRDGGDGTTSVGDGNDQTQQAGGNQQEKKF